MSCLYILEINPLSVVSFAIIFSHSERCLFTLLIVSFAVWKILSLIRSHLFTFAFISVTLGDGSHRILLLFMSSSVLPMFYSKSFIVSDLTFKSLIHFEFIFVCGVRRCSDFIRLHVAVQFSQHHCFLIKWKSRNNFWLVIWKECAGKQNGRISWECSVQNQSRTENKCLFWVKTSRERGIWLSQETLGMKSCGVSAYSPFRNTHTFKHHITLFCAEP